MPKTLASDARVTLRRLDPSDISAFLAYRCDPAVARYQSWERMDRPRALAFLEAVAHAPLFEEGEWCQIGLEADSGLIGDMGFCLTGEVVEVGITLCRPAQGQGLARRAMALALALVWTRTPARTVIAITDARNAASVRLLEASGMTFTRRDAAVFNGEPCMELTYAVRRP